MVKKANIGAALLCSAMTAPVWATSPDVLSAYQQAIQQLVGSTTSGPGESLAAEDTSVAQQQVNGDAVALATIRSLSSCPPSPDLSEDRSWGSFLNAELRAAEEASRCDSLTAPMMEAALRQAKFSAVDRGDKSTFEVEITALPLTKSLQQNSDKIESTKEKVTNQVDFMGLNWGVGVGVSLGFDKTVSEATIVNDQIVATKVRRNEPRVVLEFHKFISEKRRNQLMTGHGPFVALAATSEDVLSGAAFGWSYGFQTSTTSADGFTIGVGAILDANIKDLANGFRVGEAPPAGQTEVVFEDKARWSALIFVTRSLFSN